MEMSPIASRSSRRAGARKTKAWKRNVMRMDLSRRVSASEADLEAKRNENVHHHDRDRPSGS